MPENFVNRYQTALAAGVTSGAATGTVTSVTGVPAVPFRAIISSEGANTDEIVLVTGRAGTTLTWTRAAEAVAGVQAASAHSIGATFTAILTAVGLYNLAGRFNVRAYGAVGDGVADDTAAIAAARTAAAGVGTVYIPSGTYKIVGSAGGPFDYERIVGDGNYTVIQQATANIPVLKWGGYRSVLADLVLEYATPQAIGSTGAVGLELYAPTFATVDRLTVRKANVGVGLKAAGVTVGGGGGTINYIQNCSFRDIYVGHYSNTGMELNPFGGGSTGCVFENIYLIPRTDALVRLDVNYGFVLSSTSDSVINQLNVEAGNPLYAVYANTCDAVTFNSIHLESLIPKQDFGGFVYLNGGSYVVNGLVLIGNSILVANTPNDYGIFRLGDNTRLVANGVAERTSTVTAANFSEFTNLGTTGIQIHLRGLKAPGATRIGYFPYPAYLVERNGVRNPAWEGQGDNSVTLTVGQNAEQQLYLSALTANRTVTLSGLYGKFRITRTGLGAFTLNVGGLKTIPASTAAFVDVQSDGYGSFYLTGYGLL